MDAIRQFKGRSALERLAEIDLLYEQLERAIIGGEIARSACTRHHPANFVGQTMWANAVKVLRDEKVPEGWTSEQDRGLPLVVHPSKAVAVTVWSGDENTGRPDATPKTRRAHGTVSWEVVARNRGQLWLLNGLEGWEEQSVSHDRLTYVLLFCRVGRRIQLELSVPLYHDEQNRVCGWAERILLDPIDLDPGLDGEEPEDEPDIEIDVPRRPR